VLKAVLDEARLAGFLVIKVLVAADEHANSIERRPIIIKDNSVTISVLVGHKVDLLVSEFGRPQ
jgi:hypothetical protein